MNPIIIGIIVFQVVFGAGLYFLHWKYKKKTEEKHENELKELEEIVLNRETSIVEAHVEHMKRMTQQIEVYQNYILKFSDVVSVIDFKINEIDKKGTFKSDDEIGFFFEAVKEFRNMLNNFKVEIEETAIEVEEDTKESKEK